MRHDPDLHATLSAMRASRHAWVLAAALFALQFVVLDVVTRPSSESSLVARAGSACLWTAALLVARTRLVRAAFAAVAALVLVVQVLVFRYYHAPLDVQVAATAIHAFRDVKPVLVRALPGMGLAVALVSAAELVLLSVVGKHLPAKPRTSLALLALGAGLVAASGRLRDATPDVAAAHALSALRTPARPTGAQGAVSLPPLYATHAELPDVLVVLTESVRASDYVPSGPLATAAEAAKLTPGRTDLAQMRAVSSYTAVSVSALLTGRSQEGARDDILRAPNLFDVAHATRDARGDGYAVLYVSAQSETVFEAKDVRASIDGFVTVETVVGRDIDDAEYVTRPLDALVTSELEALLQKTKKPVFAVLHLASTHAPYYVDEANAPFTPYSHVVTWSGMPELHNAYKNAITWQDRQLARALRAFAEHAGARPRVVLFTSDHGEAFGEHGAIHHGQNLYDEQIHVPGWIWASPRALTKPQEEALASAADRFVTHLDVLPTLLDVLGLGDNVALREARGKMAGTSLLRADRAAKSTIPVTNCTGMFPCPLDTWGLLSSGKKLVAQRWDGDWACFDLNETEKAAREGDDECRRMRDASRATYPTLPNGRPNR